MKLRLTGTREQNEQFVALLKKIPEVSIYQESKPYINRGSSALERVYIELELNKTFIPADVVAEEIKALQDYPGVNLI